MNNSNPSARIAVNKNVLTTEIVNRVETVFMKNGTEFEIEIYNPLKTKIAIDVQINQVNFDRPMIVLRPGERVWLDCDMLTKKKFLFETYDVENTKETQEAIENNGDIIIRVYLQREHIPEIYFNNFNNFFHQIPDYVYGGPVYDGPLYGNVEVSYTNSNSTYLPGDDITKTGMSVNSLGTPTIETGMIADGDDSDMKFKNDNSDYNSNYTHLFKYKILPESTKKLYSKKDIIKFCIGCGRKQKKNDKYCAACGIKY